MSEEKEPNPLEKFVKHQRTAVEEAGKALLSLIPTGFREHGQKAVEESVKGFGSVIDAASHEVKKGVDRVRSKNEDKEEEKSAAKVKVEVEES